MSHGVDDTVSDLCGSSGSRDSVAVSSTPPPPLPSHSSYQFALGNSEGWLAHLHQHGFVVVKNVVKSEGELVEKTSENLGDDNGAEESGEIVKNCNDGENLVDKSIDGVNSAKSENSEDATSQATLQQCESALWAFLEEATEGRWSRQDAATWKSCNDDVFGRIGARVLENGIVNKRGAGQNAASWMVRRHENVRAVFSKIWGQHRAESLSAIKDPIPTSETQFSASALLCSYDGVNVTRPWMHGIGEPTLGGWLHVDQGIHTRGLQCVQGFVSLYEQDERTGGFVVVPRSHKVHDEFCDEIIARTQDDSGGVNASSGDAEFLPLPEEHPLQAWPQLVVRCGAGDMVLWDSRAFHCNAPATVDATGTGTPADPHFPPKDRLLRAVLYVCMTPRAWADARTLEDRKNGYNIHVTTSHWPHKNAMGFGWRCRRELDWKTADEVTRGLIGA